MRFAHSFWSKPLLNNRFNKYTELMPVTLIDYAYSFCCVKQFGHTIRLFADKIGAEMLSFIPYDEVVILDNLDNENIHFAAQIKFEAFKRMDLDEIHIDGDLFMKKAEVFEILESIHTDVLYSFYEPSVYTVGPKQEHADYYKRIKNALIINKNYFKPPYDIDSSHLDYTWPNTSLIRFGNQELKDKYIKQYYYYKNVLKNYEFGNAWPDIWIEQKHLDKLIQTGYSSRPIVYGFPSTTANNYGVFIGFVHLGGGKCAYQRTVYNWLRALSPTMLQKAVDQIQKYAVNPIKKEKEKDN